MCDCFHLAFPNWHAASSGMRPGRRLQGPEPATEDSICDEPSQFTERERPRPQGSSPVEDYPVTEKYSDSDKEWEAEHDPHHKTGKKTKKSGLGSMFEKRSTPKMSKVKEADSPEPEVIVKTAKDGCAEGLIYGGGGKEGIFIKEVVPESPASKSLKLKEGDQILSATVYFDNMSYEDAIQILEHAQAYKLKLCLKRKPEITETEPAIESNIIPEEDLYTPEMREQGKTKRRGEARISWPKFSSFGKGRKSRFIRSHSSSEAEEQRKLELSPTTSDTESPIKTQDALKYKKKHKIKLPGLTKRGRISSSEEQDTDVPTTGQISGDIHQTQESDMLSPECLESPSGEMPEVYVTEELKVIKDLQLEQSNQTITEAQTIQHKVELISIDSTLKIADLTVALADQESPSVIRSPDGKKKKKERSELKMKILGKDKSHKKDAKAKSSPKRLKTLGASFELADHPETSPNFESHTTPAEEPILDAKVECDLSDVAASQKYPQKSEAKRQKGKEIQEKQETKTGQTFKLPKISLGDVATEEIRDEAYERLAKSSDSRTQLPKREDIEIPGMEDTAVKTTAKKKKEPKANYIGHNGDFQAETVQLSIDVDSVKEAVSKLPGYKLPKVDTSGMPIPEEITVIDANAQRISVKTPTKVVDTKTKHGEKKPGKENSQEVSNLQAHEADKTQGTKGIKFEYESDKKSKKTKITMPSFGIAKPDIRIPDIGIDLPKENIFQHEGDIAKGEKTESLQKAKMPKAEMEKGKGQTERIVREVEIPEIDGIEYIDSVDGSPAKNDNGIRLTGFDVNLDAKPNADISLQEIRSEVKNVETEEHAVKLPQFGSTTPDISVNLPDGDKAINTDGAQIKTLEREGKGSKFKMPNLGISMPKVKGIKTDSSPSKKDVAVTLQVAKDEVQLPEAPETDVTLGSVDVCIPEQTMETKKYEVEIKHPETEGEFDRQGGKFKIPKFGIAMSKVKGPEADLSLSQKNEDVKLSEAKRKAKPSNVEESSVKVEIRAPEIKGVEMDTEASPSKFKMPTFKLPRFGPALPNTSAEIYDKSKDSEIPETQLKSTEGVAVDTPTLNTDIVGSSLDVKTTASEAEGKGSKFKMPNLGFSKPKVKVPKIDISLSKTDIGVTLPEGNANVKLPKVDLGEVEVSPPDAKIPDDKIPEAKVEEKLQEAHKTTAEVKAPECEADIDSHGGKFKMPKFGVKMTKVLGPEYDLGNSKTGIDVQLPEAKADVKLPEVDLGKTDVSIPEAIMEVKKTEMEMQALQIEGQLDGMPKFGIKIPELKRPETDQSLSKKHEDIKPQTETETKFPDAHKIDVSLGNAEVLIPQEKPEDETEVYKSKFKLPKFGITMPKVKGPEFNLELSKKDVNITTPESKTDISLPNVKLEAPFSKVEIKAPEIEVAAKDTKGSPSAFKMPDISFSMPKTKGPDINLSMPKKEADITLGATDPEVTHPQFSDINIRHREAEVLITGAKGKVKTPEVQIKPLQSDVELEGQEVKFKMPEFGITIPKIKGPDINLGFPKKDANVVLPRAKAEPELPGAPTIAVDMKSPECEAKIEGQGSKFKMPKFGITMSKVKGPEFDLKFSNKDVDVTLREAEGEVKLPDVEFEKPSAEVEIEAPEIKAETKDKKGSPSKFTMPTFKLPKFGVGATSAKAEVPDMDKGIKIEGADIKIPEEVLEVNIEAPSTELKEPSISMKTTGTEYEGKGSKFKFPGLGFSVPQVKGPDIDLSLSKKDVDVTLPEAKVEVKLPDVELEKPSAEVEIEAPEIKVETKDKKRSPSKFTMPTFKLPKFGVGTTSATAEIPDMDKSVKIEGADISIPEEVLEVNIEAPSTELKEPSISMKTTGAEYEGKGSKFKFPGLGFSVPQVKGPDIDLSLSKKDVDVKLPEAKAEVKLPVVELEKPSAEVEIEAPEIKVEKRDKKGSPSTFKMPTFKLPKFGVGTTSATAEVHGKDKGINIEGAGIKIPEEVLEVKIEAPSIELKEPSISMKTTGIEEEGKGSKFKLPGLGFSVPEVKGPDIDLSLSKKDVDVTLPEAKVEVKLPVVELEKPSAEVEIEAPEIKVETKDKKGSPSKFKMPTFKLPKFGVGTTSATAEVPDMDKGIKIEGADIKIPEEVLEVNIKAPSTELKEPSISMKTTGIEHEGKGSKFKLPGLGFSVPQVKGPDIDLSLSKKDVDVKLPEAKTEVKLPDVEVEKPSAEMETEAPEIKVETKDRKGSPSKFKMPTFKLPKFGVGTTSATAEVPDMDKSIKIEGADIKIPEEVLEVNIEAPSIELKEPSISMKTTEAEYEGKGSKFKFPGLGFSVPEVKGPDIDLSLSKKDVDVTLPEAKVEVKLPVVELEKPSAEVETEAPEIKVETKDKKGSPSKFTMPTFKLPKFGVGTTSATAEVYGKDKSINIEGAGIKIPEEVLEVNIETPSTELKETSISMKTTGTEYEGKGSKFKFPGLGFSVPQVKRPDIDLSLSKKDVDVKLPEAKVEVKIPDVELQKLSAEVEIEAPEIKVETKDKKGSPSKFTMPTFKLPKFGVGTTSATAEVHGKDKSINIEGAGIKIPEEVLEVNIEAPSTELKETSISMKTTGAEYEGKGSKFKFPGLGFSVPQVKRPDIDLSLSKKDVDVKLPEAKVEVKIPDVELQKLSAEVEIEAPEIKVETKDKKGSPSKFTMPTFKLPKFGVGTTSATAEVPDMDKSIKIEGADISIPEEVLEVNIEAPSTELKEPSISMKTTGIEHEGKGSKFKFPGLGFSVPQVKGPDIDLSLSKKDVDVKLPEAKVEVKPPDVELEKPSAEVEIEAPEIKVETKDKKGSPSKFKMPTFKLPKFGVGTTSTTAEVPDMDKSIKIEGADISIPEEVLEVNIKAPSTELKEPSISMKTTEAEYEGKGSKFKFPGLGFSVPQVKGPDIDLSLSKKDVDVTLPEAKVEVRLPDVELEKPSAEVEIEAPEIKVETKDKKGSPSKFKMPTFKLPKFGVGTTSATAEVPDMDKSIKIEGADISIPEEGLEVNIKAPSTELKEPSISMKTTGIEEEGKGSKFKFPGLGFSVPQVKGPDIDLSLSKKDVDVKLPEAKVEVKLPVVELEKPSAEVEIEAPEIKVETKDRKGSPSKFKMPTFKLPKFGVGTTSATAEIPDMDKGIKIEGADIKIPEEVLEVNIEAPSTELKEPSISMKTTGAEYEGKGSKFKFPGLGFAVPQVKGPDIDLSLSKKDVDVTLPEAKVEVRLPDVELEKPSAEVEIEAPEIKVETKDKKGSPSKFKMPTFKLPKFGVGTTSTTAEIPDMDKSVKIEGADISIPEEGLEVNIKAPSTELKEPSISMKTTGIEHEGKGSKFKFPGLGFSVPQVKGPDIDLSLSKKDVDVKLPAAKTEVKLPDVEVEKPSAEMETEAPEIKVETKDKKGSPSKFTMPTFKLPKFGVGTTSATAEVPDMDKSIKIEGADIKIPEEVLEVNIKAPSTELKEPSISMKTTGIEHEGKGSKFKFPGLGFSVPQVKGPDIDLRLSKKDVDVTLPEAKVEVKPPDVELEKPSAEVEIEAPEIKVETKDKKGSPSKFTMPTFKLPKFGVGTTSATAEVPDMDKSIKIEGADISIPEEGLEINIEAPSTELKETSISMKTTGAEYEGKGSKFKFPGLGFSVPEVKGPDIDLRLSKKGVGGTLPEAKTEVKLPDVELEKPSAEVKIEVSGTDLQTSISMDGGTDTNLEAKLKKPRFSLPKFSFSKQSAKELEVDISLPKTDVILPEVDTEVKQPENEFRPREGETEVDGQKGKFKMPKVKNVNISKKDVEFTVPEIKAKVPLPDVKVEQPSAKVEIKAPETEIQEGNVEIPQSKLKMPNITVPKFGASTSKVSMEVTDVDKEIKTGAEPSIYSEGVSVDVKVKGGELEVSGSKFKMPYLGISMPKVKGPETDLSLSKKDVDVSLPEVTDEVKLPQTTQETGTDILVTEVPTIEAEVKSKRPSWTFPKFSFSKTGDKVPDVDVNIESPKADIISTKAEVSLPDAEIKGPLMEEPPAAEIDTNLKKTKFSLPRFSFSKSSIKESELRDELPHADVSVPEGEVKVKHPEMEIKAPEQKAGQGSVFKFPKFGIAETKLRGPETDLNASKNNVDTKLPEIKAEVKISEDEVKQSLEIKASEIDAKSKDAGGSPLKLKIPPLKMPKFGSASYDVTTEAPKAGKVIGTDVSKLKEDVSATDKDLSVIIKMDDSKGTLSDSETPKTETDGVGHTSPSKFKLPSFKMPKLSFSRPKPEEEHLPADTEDKDQQEMEVEPKGESKSPKMILTSFGEILKTIDVEFDVPKADKVEENLVVSKEVKEIDESTGKQLETKEKETSTVQDTSKSPERTGWFKFPKFGLSSPTEQPNAPVKGEEKEEKSPVGGTGDEEISPTCSVQSSDAFADISSTVTSEHVGPSISSPTKVTVKYSDPNVATGLGETHSNIITSTTRTELISVEPNMPEKITILSSGISSSSEDTLRLESGKIHVITTNIQATPEAHHAKLLTDIEAELAGGLTLKSEASETTSWTVDDSESGNKAVFERHLVKKTSSERSESRETIVITKQITHVFDSSEPISGETASSIQRLRDSVHSEKMRFFDDAEK